MKDFNFSVQRNFEIVQIDINAAYLNATLTKDIYMETPKGHDSYNNSFWKLEKAIYCLKQAGREWKDKLNEELLKMKFVRLVREPCVYIKRIEDNEIKCILSVYVDDILIAGKKEDRETNKRLIMNIFNIKDIGDVDFVIGRKFDKKENGYILHQKGYIRTTQKI